MKRRLLGFILFSVLLSSIITASVASDSKDCGNNIRCKYKIAAQTKDVDACLDLPDEQQAACYGWITEQNPEVSVEQQIEDNIQEEKDKEAAMNILIPLVSVIVLLILIFITYLLWQRRKLK